MRDYPNAYYYVVFGERSNGKTYSALDYAIERYFKAGEQFAYIRRFGEDIRRKNLSTLFDGHIKNGRVETLSGGDYNGVVYTGSKFYFTKTDEQGNSQQAEKPFGHAFDLNGMEHYKSVAFPDVTFVVFDEFMSRNGYLPNEWVLFANALSTIIRHRRNVKIAMLGNTVNKFCPYFQEMGLEHIKEQNPGTIDVYHYAGTELQVVCEYTPSSASRGGKESDVYFAFDNPELKMITTGSWEIAVYPHLNTKILPKDVVQVFFIDFNGDLLQGNVVVKEDGAFVFIHNKTTPIKDEENDIVYSTTPSEKWNYRLCLTKQTDKLSQFINKCLREGKVFYSNNEVGEVVRNYVMWSDSYSIKN